MENKNKNKRVIDYNQLPLRKFIKEHPLLSIRSVEIKCNVPKGTLRHFIKDRRNLPEKYFHLIELEMVNYGYEIIE